MTNQAAAARTGSRQVFVLNGPNLNLLGRREPEVYGTETLDSIEARLDAVGHELGWSVDFRQHNDEGVLVDWIQEAGRQSRGVLLNPAALTHYSYALRDAIAAIRPVP